MSAKDKKFAEVDDAIIAAAHSGNSSFHSSSRVELRALDCTELCRLLKHCYRHVSILGDFILKNELTGTVLISIFIKCFKNSSIHKYLLGSHLEDAVETIEDLMELGLSNLNARLLMKRIADWKENGLPADFYLTDSFAFTPALSTNDPAVKKVRIENPQDAALASELPRFGILSTEGSQEIALAAEISQCDDFAVDTTQVVDFGVDMTEDVPQDHDNAEEKQLDVDFIAARWCWCRAATNHIFATAGFDNHLAQGYLSILCNNSDNFVG